MINDRIPEPLRLPRFPEGARDKPDLQVITDYLYEVVRVLETEVLELMSDKLNALTTDTASLQWQYSQPPNPATGVYADGAWRWGENDSGQWEVQKKVSGDWTPVTTEDV